MPIEIYHLLIVLFEALKAHEPESLTVTETQSFLKEAFNYESVKPTQHYTEVNMSHTLSAVDLEDVYYLLLDCTGVELSELNAYLCFNVFNPIHMDKLKKIVGTLKQEDLNKLPSGNLKRNLVNLMGLTNEMDDIIALDYSYDASLPTSDYKYPVVSFIPEDCDEDDEHQMLHLTITDVPAYDAFINTPMPSYIHHGVTKLGEVNNLKIFLGKTTNGSMYLYSLDEFGIQSSDLSYTIS